MARSGRELSTGATLALARAETPPAEELAPGTIVGEYELVRRIGAGGMGIVYGAKHPVIGKRAAIKVLNARYSADAEAVDRFVLEAQAVNQIGNANIVDIFAFGTLPDGRSYFAMEWLQGETLGSRMARGRLPVGDAISILATLCRTLEAAHAAGVIHRDLKPDNVFLVEDGESFRVKLLDFGIAKLSTPAAGPNRTATGVVVGTPLYMSPEQARGDALDGRTDCYSLGVLAYAMLSGHTPFEHERSTVEVLNAHINTSPTPLRSSVEIPPRLEAIVLEMLSKAPEARPSLPSIRARLAAIGPTTTTPWPGRPTLTVEKPVARNAVTSAASDASTPAIAGPQRSRRRLGAPVIAVVGVGIVVAATLIVRGRDRPVPPAETGVTATTTEAAAQRDATLPMLPAAMDAAAPPAQPRGTLELAVTPADATVTIDGVAVEVDHGRVRAELAPGLHELSASAPGRTSVDRAFEIAADRPTPLTIRLDRRRGAAEEDVDGVVDPFAAGRKAP